MTRRCRAVMIPAVKVIFKHIFLGLTLLLLMSSCSLFDPFDVLGLGGGSGSDEDGETTTASVSGSPTEAAQEVYENVDLSDLCDSDDDSCEPDYEKLPASFLEYYDEDDPDVCGFDYFVNATSQLVINRPVNDVDGLDLIFSKQDLFFLAWASMRYQVNPHFLIGVMIQESFGNCSLVSPAGAEGCFQITNFFGRLQLQQSYSGRVTSWNWNETNTSDYPESLFISEIDWLGENTSTEQLRMTVDPAASTISGVNVSSVVNFHFGVVASALYYRWQPYFLYYNLSDLRETVESILQEYSEEKALLMAAAYNAGIGNLSGALENSNEFYASDLPTETQNYIDQVSAYCATFQQGSDFYTATYTQDDVEELVDFLEMTYDPSLEIDWSGLKDFLAAEFFEETDAALSFVDDVKALIYLISTFDPALAPVWPEDIAG